MQKLVLEATIQHIFMQWTYWATEASYYARLAGENPSNGGYEGLFSDAQARCRHIEAEYRQYIEAMKGFVG